jgi:AMMECR1 domain-containing protein
MICKLKLEVTVIGTLVPVEYNDIIKEKPGKFGIYIESGHDSGTLLPEVAIKNNLSAEEFIQKTCVKAGLDKNCYTYSKIYAYKVRVFNEK